MCKQTDQILCCRIALVLGCLHLEKNRETMPTKMELENANLKEAHMTIAEKMGKQNASWKETKIANGGTIERANATWKGAHLTNEEYMEGTNASWKEATSISFLWFLFVLHCVFDFYFFLHFLSAVAFVCIFKIHFFALHAAFFQDSKIPR